METGLAGKAVVLTGAASGIGRATAEAFAREGARLGLIDHDEDQLRALAGELGDGVVTAVEDLSTAEGVAAAFDAVTQRLGTPDVLFNNVGTGAVRTFDDLSDDDWHATIELNFFAYVRAIRAVLPGMRERGSGVIVNNASDLARQPEPVPIDYAVSKAAILSLTKELARSHGRAG